MPVKATPIKVLPQIKNVAVNQKKNTPKKAARNVVRIRKIKIRMEIAQKNAAINPARIHHALPFQVFFLQIQNRNILSLK